jgi:hypothetical protein
MYFHYLYSILIYKKHNQDTEFHSFPDLKLNFAWLEYFHQYEIVHYLFCFEGLHLFISVRTLIYGANHSPKHEKRL